MTTNIYDQYSAAFSRVSAFVIMKKLFDDIEPTRVATVALKYPADGAGRLFAYVHWIGLEMVRGYAGGYGYDKRSAAVEAAIAKLRKANEDALSFDDSTPPQPCNNFSEFCVSLRDCGGNSWDGALRDAGFTVLQAV